MKNIVISLMFIVCLGMGGMCFAALTPTVEVGMQAEIDEEFSLDMWVRSITPGIQAGEGDGIVDPYAGGTEDYTGTSLDFGKFTYETSEETDPATGMKKVYRFWKPAQYFCVFVSAYTQGKPYKITHTCSTTDNKLDNTLLMAADYCGEDLMGDFKQERNGIGDTTILEQQSDGTGLVMTSRGTKVFASGTETLFFKTKQAIIAKPRIFRCWYSLANGEDKDLYGDPLPGCPEWKKEPVGAVPISDLAPGTYSGTITYTVTAL